MADLKGKIERREAVVAERIFRLGAPARVGAPITNALHLLTNTN